MAVGMGVMTAEGFQHFLDQISVCFISQEFSIWRAHILLPFTLVTARGSETFETEAALQENFLHYLGACTILSLDKIYRRPISLERCEDGLWPGTYETSLMSQGMRAVDPYASSALLHPVGDGFKTIAILNARGHHDWTVVRHETQSL